MTTEEKQLFWDYEDLQEKIKKLEEERDLMKSQILSLITIDQKVPTLNGSIVVECKKKWSYTPETETLEKELDERKKTEQQIGLASYVNGEPFVKYYSNKKNNNDRRTHW